jgi:hypothetical protein
MFGAATFLLPGDMSDTGPAMFRFGLAAVVIGVVGFSWWVVPFAGLAPLLALGFLNATDCPDCGGGGEELPAGAQFVIAVIGLIAFSAATAVAVAVADVELIVAKMGLAPARGASRLAFAAPLLPRQPA